MTALHSAPSTCRDPLERLPPELVLRALDHLPLSGLACLLRTSRAWNHFIDHVHPDAIYATKLSPAKTQTYTDYLSRPAKPKHLCERQAKLHRVWDHPRPRMREARIITDLTEPVNTWRFRPDFERRFILSTSEFGGLRVNDMDDKTLLWSLPDERVGPFTHLEYSEGHACFNSMLGDTIEVWRTCEPRGRFEHLLSIPHTVRTRGFHCRWPHLCVVSDQGKGFVYDLTRPPDKLLMTHMFIQEDAYGHVDQNDDVVMWSMGTKGYHIHSKTTGQLLGTLNPARARRLFHVKHPPKPSDPHRMHLLQHEAHPTNGCLDSQCLCQVPIEEGPHPCPNVRLGPNEDDEWGAGMLMGDCMIGISSHGRVFITADWRQSMLSYGWTIEHSAILECKSSSFDFSRGGWLAVKNHRALIEVYDRVYVLPLPRNKRAPNLAGERVYAVLSSVIPPPNLPISWMGLFDDCLMFTQIMPGRWENTGQIRTPTEFTKAIKILSFAPDESSRDDSPSLLS